MDLISLIQLISMVTMTAGQTVCGGKPADIFFLVDSSSSIWLVDYEKQRQFVINVVDQFDISPNKTRVGLAVFASGYQQLISLTQQLDKEALKSSIKRMPYMTGDTYTDKAIRYMRTRGFDPRIIRTDVVKIGIILTDGKSRYTDQTIKEAQLAKNSGIFLFAVGIGNHTDHNELKAIGSYPKENFVFQVANFDVLTKIREKLAWKACEVEYLSSDQPGCGKNVTADVIFVYDSGNLGSRNVDSINNFIVDVVQVFNMANGNIRTGMMNTNCYRGDIHLEKHTDKKSFISQVKNNEVPDLSSVIRRLRLHGFNVENGGRANARKIAILFMDSVLLVPKKVMSEVGRAKFNGVEIFVMAIGKATNYNITEVNTIATSTDHVFPFASYQELANETKKQKCVELICRDLTDPMLTKP